MMAIKGIEKTTASLFISNLPRYFEFVDENEIDCMFEGKSDQIKGDDAVFTEAKADKTVDDGKVTYSPKLQVFAGMKFVFTGFRNDALEKYIKSRGGSVSTSVSKSTAALLRKDGKDKDSSKVQKAEGLGVKIVNVNDFIEQYNIKL
jgi:NAD-dependent DNA ligase